MWGERTIELDGWRARVFRTGWWTVTITCDRDAPWVADGGVSCAYPTRKLALYAAAFHLAQLAYPTAPKFGTHRVGGPDMGVDWMARAAKNAPWRDRQRLLAELAEWMVWKRGPGKAALEWSERQEGASSVR
jgi:hypothetical protein